MVTTTAGLTSLEKYHFNQLDLYFTSIVELFQNNTFNTEMQKRALLTV